MTAGGSQSHAVTEPQRDPSAGGGAGVRRVPTTESTLSEGLCEAPVSDRVT